MAYSAIQMMASRTIVHDSNNNAAFFPRTNRQVISFIRFLLFSTCRLIQLP